MENTTIPMLALRGKMVYPGTSVFFEVSRTKSLKALEEAINKDQPIFLVNQRVPAIEKPKQEDLFTVGTVAKIQQMVKAGQGVLRVFVEGLERAKIIKYIDEEPCVKVEVEEVKSIHLPAEGVEEIAIFRTLCDLLDSFIDKNPGFLSNQLQNTIDKGELIPFMYELASDLPFELEKKQEFLEERDVTVQSQMLMGILIEESEISDIRNEITEKVKKSVDKNQKDYLLREQQKVIRKELGEEDIVSEADEYMEKCEKLNASKTVKEKIAKEIRRFKNVPPMASESIMMRNYIESMLEMPWKKASKDNKNLKKAMEILEEDHYGLEKIKERILDYLAVRSLTKKGETPILCLVGPPGTGKTSIAKSIARALNKKYVRISLGGVHDEAEIRGHRKTYIGAMPGRIAEGIRQAGVRNPLMLLDEIDKVSSDYKGDTASALLEVLDGEQNVNFRDHYLEVPLDLSEVLFIATANEPERISKPLLDRMEIIELSSYTENEKYHIARNYLVDKQRKANGIGKKQIVIPDDVIYALIRSYTREAGVRELERKIGQLMRKAARKIIDGEDKLEVTVDSLESLLGTAPFSEEDQFTKPQVGVVRGLAWTSVGGDTLSIEVNVMPGTGKLALTGRMGDVMKESAQIGLSYIRSISEQYDIEADYFETHDIHIHIPEGAVPKDGPSAGITMATAMLSALIGKKVRGDLAMTGEITLRGRVLPIGGLKEKLLAAKAANMKEVLVPAQNERNIRELDKEITDGLKISYVEQMDQVLKKALI
ncbi:MAG: endopeptidase La [Anaerobutyricum sp.]|nr:endopeptidase La [Eubacterium sp.]MDD7114834.1 endopeptidase La [Lachnospiraceae bacterium]MDY6046452.1 endopeptidase La [Anaerobutyricum sp.]